RPLPSQVPTLPQPQAAPPQPPVTPQARAMPQAPPAPAPEAAGRARSSPLVRNIAREHGVNLDEVSGTGLGGRVTKDDILNFIERRKGAPAAPAPAPVAPAPAPPAPCPPPPRAVSPPGAGARSTRSCGRARRPRDHRADEQYAPQDRGEHAQ